MNDDDVKVLVTNMLDYTIRQMTACNLILSLAETTTDASSSEAKVCFTGRWLPSHSTLLCIQCPCSVHPAWKTHFPTVCWERMTEQLTPQEHKAPGAATLLNCTVEQKEQYNSRAGVLSQCGHCGLKIHQLLRGSPSFRGTVEKSNQENRHVIYLINRSANSKITAVQFTDILCLKLSGLSALLLYWIQKHWMKVSSREEPFQSCEGQEH